MQFTGNYSLVDGYAEIESEGCKVFEDEEVLTVIAEPEDTYTAEEFVSLFRSQGIKVSESAREMFLAVVYEKKNKKLTIFSDITTSPYNLYYTSNDRSFFFSTSLKELLINSGIHRTMNMNAARSFLANGYVFGKETLINNVFKISFGESVLVSLRGIEFASFAYPINPLTEEEAGKYYQESIRKSIEHCVDNNTISIPLSGGLDSNCILGFLRLLTEGNIRAFTVGSKKGNNEIPVAMDIAKIVGNIEHQTYEIDESLFDSLPEIVWRLDGCVYESGIFLQYALARLVNQTDSLVLICGESNNEIQSERYVSNLLETLSGKINAYQEIPYAKNPFIATNLMVLKKSSVMLNSFGITGRYPYKNKEVIECAHALRNVNGSKRRVFREITEKVVDPGVFNLIESIGGTTGVSSITSEKVLHSIHRKLKKDHTIRTIYKVGHPIQYSEKLHSVKMKLREIKGRLIGSKNYLDDTPIKELYLKIFEELFITGKYDNFFKCPKIEIKTHDIIEL